MRVCPECGGEFAFPLAHCPRDGAVLRPPRDANIGRTVGGRYRLLSRLGTGGMSSVYLAQHLVIERLVAVKTLRRDLARDPMQRDRFIREARAVNRINHANIVEITDFGESDDGLVYLVMEYVPGESLLERLREAPFEPCRALSICERIAGGLGRAHEMGIVHRDLKPENVLLVPLDDGGEDVKLLDFGIAKILNAPSLTGSQQIFGTPGYIAPEYIQSTSIDGRADLYSLGVILYEMITGALPYDYEFPGDLLVKHVTEPPISPRQRLPSVHPAMEALILRCLAKRPEQRFADAYQFSRAVRETREALGFSSVAPRPPAALRPREGVTTRPLGHAALGAQESRSRYTVAEDIPAAPVIVPQGQTLAAMRAGTLAGASRDELGLLGVRRWRRRYDVLASAVRSLPQRAPREIRESLEFVEETLGNIEAAVDTVEAQQLQIEGGQAQARQARRDLGASIDAAAERRSEAQRCLEECSEEAARPTLEAQLVAAEAHLKQLRSRLEQENLALETSLETLVSEVQGEVERLDAMSKALAGPLERVEVFIRHQWSKPL